MGPGLGIIVVSILSFSRELSGFLALANLDL